MLDLNILKAIHLFKDREIRNQVSLSNSFGVCCKKVTLDDNSQYVVKELVKSSDAYNSIFYEGKCLEFMNEKFPNHFPKVLYLKDNLLVMEFIEHNKVKDEKSEQDLACRLARIHQIRNDQFGFEFDSPIGGLRQPSSFEKSWVNFYANKRLNMIFELINATNPMPDEINRGIERLLKNLNNLIPDNPQPSLIHGDLWEGNILLHNGKLVGLIDPGIYYAHHEMEIAYLGWFKYVSRDFYQYYVEYNQLSKDFMNYSEVYQLYYCLLNVHLWSRDYIQNAAELVRKYN